jgi:hypothetical protein
MAFLYVRGGRLTGQHGGFWPGQWHEQRLWGIGSAIDALEAANQPLAAALRAELAPPAGPPSVDGLQLTTKRSFSLPGWPAPGLGIGSDGSLTSGGATLAVFSYRSYSAVDVSDYDAQYRGNKPDSTSPECGDRDFCKPGMPGMKVRLRSHCHCRFVLPLIHFTTDLLRESVPLFLKRQCDRTLHEGRRQRQQRQEPGLAADPQHGALRDGPGPPGAVKNSKSP